ncbi:MAG TPA: glycosyltransferase family 39 protein [Chthoniobacterales bacterium]|nr:glycosyltransferase family 39 protein [Chthoniobacterales bacterium]
MQGSDTRSRNAIIFTIAIIAIVFGWLVLEIPKGILSSSGDEMLTAERSREMLLLGRSEVHFNMKPSFEKPPLQYWLTSFTLPRLQNKSLAVRIWPWFYGLLTAIAAARLAFLLRPERPWFVPLSVAILVSCPLFATETCRGMLDTGLALFTTLTVLFAQLARKNPAWWLATAVACVLGSLQKIPIPFLVWIFMLAVRWSSREQRSELKSRWLLFSILGCVIAMLIWPLSQILTFQVPYQHLFHQEVVDWLGPEHLGAQPYLEIPYRLIVSSALGAFLLAAPFVVVFWEKEEFGKPAREISIACLVLVVVEILFNFRHVRYAEPIIPSLCLLLALVAERILRYRGSIRIIATAVLAVLLLAGVVQTELQIYFRRQKDLGDEQVVAEKLGALQRPGLRTILVKAIKVGTDLHFASFYLFHGNMRYPVEKYTVDELRHSPPKPPLIGACVARDLPSVQDIYPGAKVDYTRAQFIIWTIDDLNMGAASVPRSGH